MLGLLNLSLILIHNQNLLLLSNLSIVLPDLATLKLLLKRAKGSTGATDTFREACVSLCAENDALRACAID